MSAILCIWNNVTSGREQAYEDWYWEEHLPQRVAHPGFLSGRRYFVREGRQRYYTLYELAGLDVVRTGAYADSLNEPSQRSRAMMRVFCDVRRAIGAVTFDEGQGIGGTLLALRVFRCPVWDAQSRATLIDNVLMPCMKSMGAVRLRLLETHHDTTNVKTEERRLRASPDGTVDWVLLLEADSAAHADQMSLLLQRGVDHLFGSEIDYDVTLYDLAYWAPGTHSATASRP